MFTSERVQCYLNTFGGHGDDTESKELKLVFHVIPITPELATEISPLLADRLFRQDDEGEWQPALQITKANFSSVSVQLQNITFFSLPEEDSLESPGVFVAGAAISNLRAARAVADALDFRLEFDVVIPMDSETMRLVEQHYKATCFLTMKPVQRSMDYQEDADREAQQQSLQDAADEQPSGKDAAAGEKPKRRRKATVTEESSAAVH